MAQTHGHDGKAATVLQGMPFSPGADATAAVSPTDLRPSSPPANWRICRFVIGPMQPVFQCQLNGDSHRLGLW